MSKPETKNRKQKRRGARQERRALASTAVKMIPASVATQIAVQEANSRKLLFMVMESVGGKVVVPAAVIEKVKTMPMKLGVRPLPGGDVVMTIDPPEAPVAAEEAVLAQPDQGGG